MNGRKILIQLFLDYVNNYLTVGKFAEHHGMTEEQGRILIRLGRQLHETSHPEA